MGTDIKVDKHLQQTKNEFLAHDLNNDPGSNDVYSLETEFSKSKKNRSIVFYVLVALFMTILLLSATTAHILMREKEKNVEVKIVEFEDLKLKELVFQIGDNDSQVKTITNELADIKLEESKKISVLNMEYNRLTAEVLAIDYSSEERETIQQRLLQEKQSKLNQVKQAFQKKYDIKNKELITVNEKISNDQEKIALHPEDQKSILNPEQTLYELKINAIRTKYEQKIKRLREQHEQEKQALLLKYNPNFTGEIVSAIIQKPAQNLPVPSILFSDINQHLVKAKVVSKDELDVIRRVAESQILLIAKMKSIPFQNSPQRIMLHLDSLSKMLLTSYNNLTNRLVSAYNPEFKDANVLAIMQQNIEPLPEPELLLNNTNQYLTETKILLPNEINTIQQNAQAQLKLIEQMRKIPFYNSPQTAMLHIDSTSKTLMTSLNNLTNELVTSLQNKEDKINELSEQIDQNELLMELYKNKVENSLNSKISDNSITAFRDPRIIEKSVKQVFFTKYKEVPNNL
jgi:hypothetical protein